MYLRQNNILKTSFYSIYPDLDYSSIQWYISGDTAIRFYLILVKLYTIKLFWI